MFNYLKKKLRLSLHYRIFSKEMIYNSDTKTIEEVDVLEKLVDQFKIVLYNDEVNTFDFVIDALISVCEHEPIQAEQCTLLVHFKGKCDVKSGDFDFLEPICSALLDRGLTAQIE